MAGTLGGYAQEEAATDTVTAARPASPIKKNVKTRPVSGRVFAVTSGTPLGGALVSVSGYDGYSALTEEDGTYKLDVPEYATALKITAPDYNTVRVGINQSGKLRDVTMYSSAMRSAYGADDNILNTVVADKFDYSPSLNITSEIGDQLGANVRTISRGGTPGIGNFMMMNGINSLHSNGQPLVVIDGVIVDQQYDRTMIHDGFYNDILTSFNVNEIKSVKVMANGTAIYGAKGANGVILIETKRNTSLATKIDATVSAGITLLPKSLPVMSGSQFKTYASDLLKTTGTNLSEFQFLTSDPNNYYYNKYNNNTDWNDVIYREAFSQNYGISVQGGDEVASYFLALGYNGAQSVLEDNDVNRLNIRFNTDINMFKHLFIRFDASYSNVTRNLKDQGAPEGYNEGTVTSVNYLGLVKSPMLSPYAYSNGKISDVAFDNNDEDYLDQALASIGNVNYRLANPASINEYGTAQNKNYFENSYLNIAITPRWQFNKHLSLSSLFSYTLTNTNDKYYVPINGVPDYYVSSIGLTVENEIRSLYSSQNSITSDTKIEWGNQYGAHSIDLLGGFRYMNDRYKVDTQLGYNTGSDKTPFINDTQNKVTTGSTNEWTSMSWYGQARYDYRKRYFVEGNLAIESSSRFGKEAKDGFKLAGVRWGVFPGIQAGWVLSNESWFDVPGIDYAKFTMGYDVSGNDGIDFDATRTYFKSILFQNKANGLVLGNLGNTEVQWETTRRFSFGTELNFLKNRLNLKVNVFKSWTDNLLTYHELNFITGLENNWVNGGSLENKGYNITVNGHIIATRNWNWELGASVGHYKNKLTALPDGQDYVETEVYGATIRSQIGQPVNLFYGYKTEATASGTHVYATSEEAKADGLYILGENGIDKTYFGAGDVKFADNGDKEINKADMQVIGDPNPDIYGNIFTSLSYKRIRLDVNFNYSLGNDAYNYLRSQLESGNRFMNQSVAMVNRWSYEGQVTDMPTVMWEDPMGNARFSDRWIEDASYLRLKSITLSYELPLNSTFIHGLTFWGQANNVFTVSKYLGADPDFSMSNSVLEQGIDRGLLANSRNFMLGIKINL
ncbi:MAG TPA: SusC/RagA family TonB-linked outer membrane protein [Paraprevotella xylaniphila]|uniref:SusC/RagA family TonB-linked outer membrane protein n=1 Tax=Paraprevotella xylaniphila TaxID=454155 RepID=UPI000ECF5F41|nr:SusC/RagA family TonB-linked outer membrane protein [Paraprevotella xylaniphila]